MGLIVVIILGFIACYAFYAISQYQTGQKRKENERKEQQQKKSEQDTGLREKLKKQREIEEMIREADKNYDRIINCPACKGRGKVFKYTSAFRTTDSNGREYAVSKFWVFPDDNDKYEIQRFMDDRDDCTYIEKPLAIAMCPFCQGKGIAYAWFKTIAAHTEECQKCQGKGHVTTQVKLDVGVGEQQIPCESCAGTGKVPVPEKKLVHYATLSGNNIANPNYSYSGQYPRYDNRYNVNSPFLAYERFEHDGEPRCPMYGTFEIDDNNCEFFSKSKPRNS